MLIGIHLQNFGVLHDTTVGLVLSDLRAGRRISDLAGPSRGAVAISPIAALIGRNSTGKSSLLDALSFLADCLRHGVQYAANLNERGGFARLLTYGHCREIRYDLLIYLEDQGYYLNYNLTLVCDGHGRPHVAAEEAIRIDLGEADATEQTLLKISEGQGLILDQGEQRPAEVADKIFPALSAYGALLAYPELQRLHRHISHWYFCQFNRKLQAGSGSETEGGQRHLNANCDNASNVLAYYKEEKPSEYSRIIKKIGMLLQDESLTGDAFLKGKITSGNLKLFTLLLLLEDPRPRPLICLEEPDIGLYHDMVDTLALEMREYTLRNPGCQIIYTTHNPYILESMRPDEVWVFERREVTSETSGNVLFAKARCVGQDPLVTAMYKQGVGMGSMWYSGHFDQQLED